MRLVLASASPARLSVLRAAGVEPLVRVSGVDEDAVAAGLVEPSPADFGKPDSVELARTRWSAMAGGQGDLLTGHAVLRLTGGRVTASATGVRTTTVRFGRPSERELAAYLATGEPLTVAGAFTLDGLGGWFVEGVDGDPSSVIGISLPLTRQLLAEVGVSVVDLWRTNGSAG